MDRIKSQLAALHGKKIAIFGATGQVGRRLISILATNDFPAENLTFIGRTPSKISYNVKSMDCHEIDKIDLLNFDLIFNCMPASVIKNYIGLIWNDRCFMVDKSNAFRMDHEVPLVVPEINGDEIIGKNLVASPNCVAIPLSMVLHAILDKLENITQVAVSTYQSVSGAGNGAMVALLDETKKTFFNPKIVPEHFEKQIAFNLIPKIGEFDDAYSTDEENRIEKETNKILKTNLPISVMAVRVPTLISHAIALHIACKFKDMKGIESDLNNYAGIKYIEEGRYVGPIEAAHEDDVYVSRLKRTSSGLAMWVVCDNLHKGAALNALQVACRKFSS